MTALRRHCERLGRPARKGEIVQKLRDGLLTLLITAMVSGFLSPR